MAIGDTNQVRTSRLARANTRARFKAERAEWRFVLTIVALVLVVTSLPYIFGFVAAPDDKRFVGIMLGVPDHTQYFAWMRDLATDNLAPNRMTPEANEPAFFNLLWWSVGHIGAWTGLEYSALFSMLRVFSIIVCLGAAYAFFRLVVDGDRERRITFVLFTFSAGLGIIWVFLKYALGQGEVMFPHDLYTAEANTFMIMLGFPHFTLALGLLIAVFGLVLLGVHRQQHRYTAAAGLVALVLGLQHTYDLITIYAVIGLFGLLLWVRDRTFPRFLFVTGVIVAGLSAPPAAYSVWLVQSNPVWGEVLSQFDGAGVFTPNPLHLPILLGVPFLLALVAFRPRMLQSRNDRELFVASWFVAHFALAYLPVNFQIHLLLGWQVPIAILAAAALTTKVVPWVASRSRVRPVAIVTVIIAIAIFTNIYITSWRFIELGRYEQPYFLSTDEVAVLDWLETHATEDDVVFSDENLGQFVPVWSDASVFLGHWTNTLDFQGKRAMVEAVLDPASSDQDRVAIFQHFDVSYLVVRGNGGMLPLDLASGCSYLSPAYSQGQVAVYRVQTVSAVPANSGSNCWR